MSSIKSNRGRVDSANPSQILELVRLEFSEPTQSEDFKTKVCLPYFKDIYKDLSSRSDDKNKGINKLTLLDYFGLPGVLTERIFTVLDKDHNGYLNQKEFLTGLICFYCSSFDEKIRFVFEIYDFDADGLVTKSDIMTLINCMPVVKTAKLMGEGKFTQEGGGVQNFEDRVQALQEMYAILDNCFLQKEKITLEDFQKITEEISSDMFLSMLSLFRERLPCSENYWRYKRNYEIHMDIIKKDIRQRSMSAQQNPSALISMIDEENKSDGG